MDQSLQTCLDEFRRIYGSFPADFLPSFWVHIVYIAHHSTICGLDVIYIVICVVTFPWPYWQFSFSLWRLRKPLTRLSVGTGCITTVTTASILWAQFGDVARHGMGVRILRETGEVEEIEEIEEIEERRETERFRNRSEKSHL